jgi:phosphohistidine phosphatase
MKQLLLLRHAKSSWKDTSLPDHDRPLNRRGEKTARRIGSYLEEKGLFPDQVLCSTALRALRTWDVVAAQLEREVRVSELPEIYSADADGLLHAVRGAAADADAVMLIGHNPALQELAVSLFGSGNTAALEKMRRKYPTGGLAVFHFDTGSWAEVAPARGELERFVRPKQLQR